MEPVILAKGAAGKCFSDLVKACEDHFNWYYPECVNTNDHKTVMCPPVFPFGYVAPTGKASGAKELSKVEEDTIRGDTAELKIFHLLEKFGEMTKQPMFVLTQLKLSEFLKNVLQQNLPGDHPVLKNNFNGEIDFVIIHRKIGVILMEVKSKFEFSKSLQSEARKQLQKGEEIILSLLKADHEPEIGVPVYKVIAMPNVSEKCRGKSNFIGLRGFDVRSDGNFNDWWQSKFREIDFDIGKQQKLQNIISIFVGQRSEVNSVVLSRVFKKINTQNFLQKSYKKGVKGAVTDECEVVSKPAEDSEQAILSKQFLFLNPEQLRIWNSGSHTIFNGSSGSGKTILLQFRALRCAKAAQQKVVVVVPMPLIALYKEFFSQNGISLEIVEVLSPVDFFNGSYFESDATSRFHFFADELQAFQTDIPDLSTRLEKVMASFVESECYCWIAYDYMQRNENATSLDVTGGLSSGAKLQTEARNLCKTYGFHHASCLKTVVRSTLEIYDYVQGFVKNCLEDMLKKALASEHIDEKTKRTFIAFVERYDISNYLGHRVCGPSVAVFEHSELGDIVRIITSEISKWTTEDALNRVAILVTSQFLKENLSQLMTMEKIPVCDVGQQTNGVVLDYGYKAHSYEWPVVIAVSCTQDQCLSANYIMLTRAVTRLLVIKSIYSR